jgi:nucleoside-triphosphatase THEP1
MTTTDGPRVTALVYADSAMADQALRRVVRHFEAAGLRLAGVVQRDTPRAGRTSCDMTLEELSTGVAIAISQDRGPLARGCRLDLSEMARAIQLASAALQGAPDMLVLNKFGKTEVEGGGFRALIAEAIQQGVPVLIAVPYRNIDPWRAFAGDLAREIHLANPDANLMLDRICPAQTVPMPPTAGPLGP